MQNFHFCRLKLFFSHGFQRLHCSACVSLGLIGEVTKVFRSRNWRGLEIEDLIEDLMNYFNDDDVYERQSNHYYELARERYDNGGKEELLKSLFDTTVAYFNADVDFHAEDFGDFMSRQFADEIQDGNWDEFLSELWGACITYQGAEDDHFYALVNTRNFKIQKIGGYKQLICQELLILIQYLKKEWININWVILLAKG